MTAVSPDPFDVPVTSTDWRRRIVIAIAVFAVVALVGGLALSRSANSSTGRYRTALVGDHDVESVLTGVGSIEPVSQATVAFPIKGTVASVDVAVGDTVSTGQTLATVDTADLTAALHDKQATLASAQLALSKALTGSSSSASSASSASASPASPSVSGASGRGSASTGSSAAIAAAQQAVVAGQQAVDAALAVADQALASSAQVCAAAVATAPAASTTSSTATTSPTATDPVTACQAALQGVQTAQAAVAAAQAALATRSSNLDALLAQQAAAQSAATGASGSTGAGSGTTTTTSARSAPGGSGSASATGSTASSSDLIARQKAVDAAQAEVAVAEQDLAQTTIVSPISGAVAVVALAVGDAVTASSSSAHVVVVGSGGLEVTTMVSVDHIPDVKVGQAATVLPDGATDPLSGQVVAIALTPTTATTGTTYRVTIGLEGQGAGLGNGATGSVSIVTAGVTAALSVPTSAVHTDGTTHTVTVVDGSSTSSVTVKVGVIGATYTQITDGLTAGQSVLLADLDQALPGSATSSSNGAASTNQTRGPFTGFTGAPPGFTPGGR
jgi:HlyD family secretion protein